MKKAFSLIEASIVILIIGILIAGVTQSSVLIKKFRLSNAQTLTQSSPVASIKDLLLWYETSMENSFIESEQEADSPVSAWYDINPQSINKNHAGQATANKRPQYTKEIFNGAIPGLKFDGINDSLTLSEITFPSPNLTAIAVFKPFTADENGEILSTTSNDGGRYQIMRYQGNFSGLYSWNGATYSATVTASADPQIVVFTQNGASVQFYQNGTTLTSGTVNNEAYKFSQIAELDVDDQEPFNGYIAEIIIFTRTLKTEERRAIEAYLGKKYNITVS